MFICKRGRPDASPGVSYNSTRIQTPNEGDWKKVLKLLGFLIGTVDDILTLEADNTQTLTWYIDALFTVHPNMKRHIGAVFALGKEAVCSYSSKQKVNSRSTPEAELVAIDDKIAKVVWTK
eukprot:8845848-Ditylum_brightwellii.AAC.1